MRHKQERTSGEVNVAKSYSSPGSFDLIEVGDILKQLPINEKLAAVIGQ
jgi:hypothetical protein